MGQRLIGDVMSASGWTTTAPPTADVTQTLDEPVPAQSMVARLLGKPREHAQPMSAWREQALGGAATMIEFVPETLTRPLAQFHSVDDVPVYVATLFNGLAPTIVITGLCIVQHYFPTGFYGAYMAIVLICVMFLVYVALFRPIPPRRIRVSDGSLVSPLEPLRYARDMGIAALVFLVAGIGLYAIGDATGRYDTIPHSIWHILGMLAVIFGVEAVAGHVDTSLY
jgi:hypothetical protein